MARFLHIYVGSFDGVKDDLQIKVIGQTTETGDQMVARGENVGLMMAGCPDETLELFTNNDHFFNGVRLACQSGSIDHTAVTIYEYEPAAVGLSLRSFTINKNGRLPNWPNCMCAHENALMRLI